MAEIRTPYDFAADPMTFFWLIKTIAEWLALPPHGEDGRFAFGENVLDPILARYPGAQMRFFDSEAYTADCSDVMVWTVKNLADYNGVVNELRETKFCSAHFTIENIILTIENECAKHYKINLFGQS